MPTNFLHSNVTLSWGSFVMIIQACIDLIAGRCHKLVHWVWQNPRISFSLPRSIWFDFDNFRGLATCVMNTVPLNESRPSRLFGWLFQETWLASLALPLLPPIIPCYVSPRNHLVLHALILSLQFTWYSSSPIRLQTRPLCLWMHLEFERKTRNLFTFCFSTCNFNHSFPMFFGSTRGRVQWQLDSMQYSIRILIHSTIQPGLWSDEHFSTIHFSFLMRKSTLKRKRQ